ncbi:hypothetical protein OQJ68_10280 [Microbulbifer thermotolerans]|uniref:Capsular polysaccharide transport system permease protein n=1 Tax=Microbulbifer thermotolerans TaxID=252514 RepID=A0AB35I0E1_MICTH|nr:hypothetical protein [Microbulbifer thermotolerans]MCX2802173.1 hypothetical protein [Microbulbifer thermotolerans]
MNTPAAAEKKPNTDSGALKKASQVMKGIVTRFAANEPRAEQGALNSGFRRWRGLALAVGLPLLLVGAYYLFWVSDRYVSSTQLIVKDNSSSQNMSSALGFLVPGMGGENQDAYLVVNYIQSLDMALYLDEELNLSDYYKSNRYDFFSRLASDASQEDYLEYFREHISVGHDETSGIITIEMQAFEADFARQLVETATRKAEEFVNAISNQLAEKQMAFVRGELELAQSKLRASKQAILDFQNRNKVFSPEELTKGISGIIQGLEARLAEQRTALSAAKTYLNPDSPQVVSIQAEIAALERQIAAEKERLVGVSDAQGEQRLNSLSANFQNLELDLQFATDAYAASLKALESARMEASGKLKHLMVVSQPSLAEEAEYPRKLYNLVSLAVVLLLIYGIGKMLVASIRDHRV